MFYRISLLAGSFLAIGLASFVTSSDQNPKQEKTETYEAPLGLPAIPWPKDNPYSKEKAELGRLLYYDKRLSADGTVSCATCHNQPCGYSDCRPIAVGIEGHKGTRHSPTVINTAYLDFLFWDGRAKSLEQQCEGPIANVNEMSLTKDAHEAHRKCAEKIQQIAGYRPLFKSVFGTEEMTMGNITKAIATFERTILSGNSPFDRYQAGDKTALTQQQIDGYQVFKKSGCAICHGGVQFTYGRFENIGIGMDKPNPDLGRYNITHSERDWGAFKAPTLRQLKDREPFMHDGSHATLEEVIDYYDRGGIPNKNLHPLLQKPLHLTPEEKKALISFLDSLNGEGWQKEEPAAYPQ